jgi:insulysin
VPVKNIDQIQFYFFTPTHKDLYKTKPLRYVSHILGHEGPNSLLSYLIEEGLALSLCSYDDNEKVYTDFGIQIRLTPKGLDNYEEVIRAVFNAIKVLKDNDLNEDIFKEMQFIENIKFDNMDKRGEVDYCVALSQRLGDSKTDQEIKDLLWKPHITKEFDPVGIKKAIDDLSHEKLMVFLSS